MLGPVLFNVNINNGVADGTSWLAIAQRRFVKAALHAPYYTVIPQSRRKPRERPSVR